MRNERLAAGILTVALSLVAAPAGAQDATTTTESAIPGFKLTAVKAKEPASIPFADQFKDGTSYETDIHMVNLSECKTYNQEVTTTTGALEAEGAYGTIEGAATDDATVRSDTDAGTTEPTTTTPGECELGDVDPIVTIQWEGDSTALTATQWKAYVGTCTAKDTIDADTGGSCHPLTSDAADYKSNGNSFDISLPFLLGTRELSDETSQKARICCDDVNVGLGSKSVNVWIAVTDGLGAAWQKVTFSYDYSPPTTPKNVAVDDAGETVTVSWDKVSEDEGLITYQVYYSTQDFTSRISGIGVSTFDGTHSSGDIKSLEVGTLYYIAVGAKDDYGNEGALSSTVEANPVETVDGFEQYKAAGGAEQGGFCFVATAAYGSPIHPHVQLLRGFRDTYLLTSELGRAFVRFYYSHGPEWAFVVTGSNPLRVAVQVLLVPLLLLSWFLLKLTLVSKVAVVLLALVLRKAARDALRRRYWAPAPLGLVSRRF